MAIIKCPECGNNVSDKASVCIHCGFPLSMYMKDNEIKEEIVISDEQLEEIYIDCNKKRIQMIQKVSEITGWNLIKSKNRVDLFLNKKFPQKELTYTPQKEVIKKDNRNPQHIFRGIYRYSIFGPAEEVYCTRCGSENCSHYQEQQVIPGKTKTSYTVNLNPLKPFTFANKKEKTVRNPVTVQVSKFVCNDCGQIFE